MRFEKAVKRILGFDIRNRTQEIISIAWEKWLGETEEPIHFGWSE